MIAALCGVTGVGADAWLRGGKDVEEMIKHALGSVLLICVAGCENPQTEVKEPSLRWEAFSDGSKISRREGGADPVALVRCWSVKGQQDCVFAYGDEWTNVRRTRTAELPVSFLDQAAQLLPVNGYDCDMGGGIGNGYQEHIGNGRGQLKSHVAANLDASSVEESWTRQYVEDFFKVNAIKPRFQWFDCYALSRKLNDNSLETLASTDVDRSVIGED